jgi:hypothetical protein
MLKRTIIVILLIAIGVSALWGCNECQHEWTEGTCAVLSSCAKCGTVRGGLSDSHEYEDGICIYCGKVSDETKAEIVEAIKVMYVSMWREKYNEKEPMIEPGLAEINVTYIAYSNGEMSVNVNAFLKMQSMGYFVSQMKLIYERDAEGKFVLKNDAEQDFGVPVELDPSKNYALYLLDGNPKFVRKTGNGEERYVLEFSGDEMIRSYYDADGNYSVIQTMDYIMHRTPEYKIVIASDDTYSRTMILKSGKYIHDNKDVYTFEYEE